MKCLGCGNFALSYICNTCTWSLPPEQLSQAVSKMNQLQEKLKPKIKSQKQILSQKMRELADNGSPTADVFYRRMSKAEYEAITAINSKINIGAAIKYANSDNYRLWFSTSLAKCDQFENENASESDIVVKLTFTKGFSKKCMSQLKPHQLKGVQGNSKVIAYHREGFLQFGNVNTEEEMQLLLSQNKHFNIGFTDDQLILINSSIIKIEIMEPKN